MKKLVLFLTSIALAVAGTSVAVSAQTAEPEREAPVEIQTHDLNKDCDYNFPSTSSTAFVPVANSEVEVNTGFAIKDVVVEFSTEVFASPGNRVDLRWSIDGGAAVISGPEYLYVGNPYGPSETRTAVAVLQLKGKHVIRPMIRSSAGTPVSVAYRCLTARLGPA